ncbi:hypothetical protein E2320_007497 [Naja naja]|nr:hypothetical protein E2320_007497 [Naja naja]
MASESMVAEQGKHTVTGRRHQKQERTPLNSDGEEDTFVFEANEAWKDFHSSLLHFYETGKLCDVTLKDIPSPYSAIKVRLPLLPVCFLMGVVAKEQIVKQNLKCRDLLDEARNYHLHLSSHTVPDFEYSVRTTPRKHTAGKVYAVGGHDGNEHLGSMEVFDTLTNKWMMKASMNTKRWELVGSVSHCRAGAGVAVCACLSSQIRDMGQGSSNVVDCM